MKISTTSEIGVITVMEGTAEGPFDKQPPCEKDIPSETSIEFVGVALGAATLITINPIWSKL